MSTEDGVLEGIIVERFDIDGSIECYPEADTYFVEKGVDNPSSGMLTLFGPRLDDPNKRRPIATFAPNTWATVRQAEIEILQMER